MPVSRKLLRLSAGLVWLCLFALCGFALAQGDATPIQIGQNAFGELTAEVGAAHYALTTNGGEAATIQVLALSPGFIPRFRLLNPAGVEILAAANPDSVNSLSASAALSDAGVYTIEVLGKNGTFGQFALSLQPGTSLPEPVDLPADQAISATVGSGTPVLVYRFSTTTSDASILTILSQSPGSGPLVSLFDQDANKTIATNDAGVTGVAYRLPPENKLYRVEIHASGDGSDTPFSICWGRNCGGLISNQPTTAPTPQVIPPAETPEASQTGCSATSSAGGSVNLRSGPGTQYAILASLPLGQTAQVLAQWKGGGWYEVNVNGSVFWVGGSVVSLSGDCSALPLVAAPTNVPLAPTQTPTPQPQNNGNNGNNGNDNNGGDNGGNQPPQDLPNLTTTNVQVSNPGDGTLNIDVTVINAGTAPVDAPYAVKTCIDTTNCNEITGFAAGLQPGETMSFTDGLPFTPNGGGHTVLVTVDSQNQVTESNESDNDAFASFNG